MSQEMKTIPICTDVLVIGGGSAGAAAADKVAEQGYNVILTSKDDAIAPAGRDAVVADLIAKAEANDKVEILCNTVLAKAMGAPGDFTVTLKTGDKTDERKVGAIVVANGFSTDCLSDFYGVELGDKIISQSDLENSIASGNIEKGKVVAFVVGFGQEGNPLVMERVLSSIAALNKIDDTEVFVFAGDMKLAADGLDRLYAQARQEGVLYFKTSEAPSISVDGGAITMTANDPVLRKDVELSPDLLVVEEAMAADADNAALAGPLEIKVDGAGFLQPENVHFFPVKSTRKGIFVAGAARDILSVEAGLQDAANVALEVRKFLGDGQIETPASTAFVDVNKCTVCLTCYRCCPHGAIYWDSRAIISEIACQGCGMCASECPNDAIQVGMYEDDVMAQAVQDGAGQKKDPWIVAFCCKNSGIEAMKMAQKFGMRIPKGLQTIEVPCAGKIDVDYIMDAFVQGADGVMVLTCHDGNCKSDKGPQYASWRVEDAKRMLAEVGLPEDRLVCASVANNMGRKFSEIAVELQRAIRKADS